MAARRAGVLDEVGEVVGAKNDAAGIGEVWQMAHEDLGETLLVEEDFHYPGQFHTSGLLLSVEENASDTEFMGDAVDDLIECVLENGCR